MSGAPQWLIEQIKREQEEREARLLADPTPATPKQLASLERKFGKRGR